jgi:hypothetical protein
MDDICVNKDGEFRLQVQQKFLKDYIDKVRDWRSLLLYHEIGSGKTCTAITVAEEFIHQNQNTKAKISVILPARLRTNFIDELMGPCTFQKYISSEDYILYKSHTTSATVKNAIKKKFMTNLSKYYNIMSYEGFRKLMLDHKKNIIGFIKKWTKNNLIVIDEVHNVFSTKYDSKVYDKIEITGEIHSSHKGMNAILMNLISRYGDDSCRMIYLTATPIFNNIDQLRELVKIMSPEVVLPSKNNLTELIELLRGKVSYFPGISKKAYPSMEYVYHNVKISKSQDEILDIINQKTKPEDALVNVDNENAFMIQERLHELCVLPKDKIDVKDLQEYAPKIYELIVKLNVFVGKQVVYTNFIERSIKIIEKALKHYGWYNLFDVIKYINNPDEWKKYKYRIYAVWSGDTKDEQKHIIKSLMNSRNNLFGENVRVVIGSPSIKEGISFLHVQHMHLIDPVWNMSSKLQVEGRVIRYCSHVDIDENKHKPLKRHVEMHIYKLTHNPKGRVQQTADEKIYDEVIPKKYETVEMGEKALKKVALDYHLFKNMYNQAYSKSPSPPRFAKSDLSYEKNDNKIKRHNVKDDQKCPKKRRPIRGRCPTGWDLRTNKHGYPCCYKMKKAAMPKELRTCPAKRRPVNGKCTEGYVVRNNKHNVPCCYKIRRAVLPTA